MTKRYRLLARAQMHGAIREPGYIFTLAEGELGPHRTVVSTNLGGVAWRKFSEPWLLPPEARPIDTYEDDPMLDVPLYDPVNDDANHHTNRQGDHQNVE
jgi:hypothetical protein